MWSQNISLHAASSARFITLLHSWMDKNNSDLSICLLYSLEMIYGHYLIRWISIFLPFFTRSFSLSMKKSYCIGAHTHKCYSLLSWAREWSNMYMWDNMDVKYCMLADKSHSKRLLFSYECIHTTFYYSLWQRLWYFWTRFWNFWICGLMKINK